jgi:hypothetical protein
MSLPRLLVFLLCALAVPPGALAADAKGALLAQFRQGALSNVTEIVFCTRKPNPTDGHWYANFSYYAADPNRKAYREGSGIRS